MLSGFLHLLLDGVDMFEQVDSLRGRLLLLGRPPPLEDEHGDQDQDQDEDGDGDQDDGQDPHTLPQLALQGRHGQDLGETREELLKISLNQPLAQFSLSRDVHMLLFVVVICPLRQ